MSNMLDVLGQAISVGDHVRLTGTGTLPMTVYEVGENKGVGRYYAKCQWFDSDDDLQEAEFPCVCLELLSTVDEVAEDCRNNE